MSDISDNFLKNLLDKTKTKEILIEVFGLGYVGLPLSIRLGISGFDVLGIDTNQERIDRLEQNQLHETEKNFKKDFLLCRENQNLKFSSQPRNFSGFKVGFVCVPTPINDGSIDSNFFVKSAIKNFLHTSKKGDLLIVESSIEVGTMDYISQLIEDYGNYKTGVDFGLCFCPERIDPQNKKWNLDNIPRVIYCSDDISFEIAQSLYYYINNSNLFRVGSAKIAEAVKSYENAFRLVNISLVNELAMLCDRLEINVKEVINAASTKPFGFMPFYPGAGAGGHCIPKDPMFLVNSARNFNSQFRTIENAIRINTFMPEYIASSIEKTLTELDLNRSVIVCGLSYKPDIEDMRDSPGFKILNEFHKKRLKAIGYDPYFQKPLVPKYLIENHLPSSFNLECIDNLNSEILKKYGCLCVVQPHKKSQFRITEIYKNSEIPLIYDCQNLLELNPSSRTILKSLG